MPNARKGRRLLRPLSARQAAYLVSGVAMAAVSFAFLVTAVTASALFAITILGPPFVAHPLAGAGRLADLERRRAALVLGTPIPAVRHDQVGRLFGQRVRLAARARTTWKEIGWLAFLATLGFAGGTLALSAWIALGWALTLPLYWWALPPGNVAHITDS
jgi:hypothetical protein